MCIGREKSKKYAGSRAVNPDPQKNNADPQPWSEGCGTDAERAVKRIRSEVVEMVGRYVLWED